MAATQTQADRYVETVSQVIESLASIGEGSEMPERLARALVDHFDAGLGEIWMRNEGGSTLKRLTARAAEGEAPEADLGLAAHFEALKGPWTGPIAKLVKSEGEFSRWAKGHAAEYALVHPLMARDHPVGALAVYAASEFTAASASWARLYAGVAAVTMDDARVLLESRKAITQLQFLVEASQVLNSTLDLAELLDLILKLALREIGADRGSVYVVDKEHREIWTILA